MKLPVLTPLTLYHEVIRVIRHLTLAIPSKHTKPNPSNPTHKYYISTKSIKSQPTNYSSTKTENKHRLHSHSNSVGRERSSSSFVLKSTVVIFSSNILQLGVVLEGVHCTLALNGVSALHIIVVGQEQLFGSMELPPPSNRLLRPVIPPHSHFHAASAFTFDLLDARHVRRLSGVRRAHQDGIPSCKITKLGQPI